MANAKYTKFKNTGVIFELLVRQITSDTLEGVKKSPAISIIKEFFKKNTTLSKELKLYQFLQNEKFKDDNKADKLVEAVLVEHKKLNYSFLKRQKYNLIKEIKNNYDLEIFLKTNISNYKLNASIYRVFETSNSNKIHNPKNLVDSRYTIVEHITGKGQTRNHTHSKVLEAYRKQDKDLRILSYRILLEKFNSKYGSLDLKQKSLLKQYINNISNSTKIKDYIDKEITEVKKSILISSQKLDNKVIRIKLDEVANQLNKVRNEKKVNDKHILALMRSYSLKKEIKNVIK